jgi:hypothetical protein
MGVTASKEIKMPLRSLNRQQTWLLSPTLDELLRGAISRLRSCTMDMFFLKIVFNDHVLLLAAS